MKYVDGEYYHVYNRGSRKQRIAFGDDNFFYFVQLCRTKSHSHRVAVVAHCIMPNHFHLVVRQLDGGSVQKFVQATLNSYVQGVNKQQSLSGTLFQGKTKARHIDSESYLLHVVRYIHLNPVEAKLVDKPEEWRFSDYREWTSLSLESCRKDREGQSNSPDSLTESIVPEIRKNLLAPYFEAGIEYAKFVEAFQEERDLKDIRQYTIEK